MPVLLLDQTFNYLKNEGVQELILDLRYNGGGECGHSPTLGQPAGTFCCHRQGVYETGV
ncbi:S41 family peptidase [Thermonema sp.]|uniref:S41 family peptidase n=1 Tax=Thermonema sp. TaxID=2231181 RepID=UPI0035B63DDA